MFKVGDKVFCPLRGAGIVATIEERKMLDETKEYIIIKLQSSNTTVMIPTDKVEASHFRFVSDETMTNEVLEKLADKETEIHASTVLKQRMKVNKERLMAGSLADYGEVIRELTHIQRGKALNASENAMLMEARKFLADELSLIKSISMKEATKLLDKVLA
ncbi:CarD family transcriptional regulator [Cellulosilyticum sp. ST5]|uniref:Transcriptional regulator, CarD family n=1 Tax=Cellulosilyticum lentocellum (strain ATCC 49066 / DSM 5427 / NCIMB 11756 / RHM5) TaxID=642492 RepID=F2JPT3_CELLD|nr:MULTISPECIES: CarD family transcriptional regulator [Cellulosilyticum]ADZ84868.1 transcriptional regulator, CarD family [Cellulosilyticum lentocellum DSM 5427]QEH70330.1 transcription factor YdeB [Cellulosilyticum sp. WCF-2]